MRAELSRSALREEIGCQYKNYVDEVEEFVRRHLEQVDCAVATRAIQGPADEVLRTSQSSAALMTDQHQMSISQSLHGVSELFGWAQEFFTFGPTLKSAGESSMFVNMCQGCISNGSS